MKTIIKIILASILFLCLLKMPYGYYQFVRIACFVGFAYLAYTEYLAKNYFQIIACIAAAILLNPFDKVHFERELWNKIDLLLAIVLIVWTIIELIIFIKIGKEKHT